MKKLVSLQRFATTSVALAALLCASPATWAQPAAKSFVDMVNKFALVPTGEPESEMLARATAAVNFIKRMELAPANKAINEALQLDARNSHLHFLNGFVYHLQARQGDSQKVEMAIEGYQQALRIDQGNWIAQEFLGLAYMDLKKFDQAKVSFSEVLLMYPDSTVSLYGLMVASYLTGDAVTACTMADQFQKAAREAHDGFIRSSVSVYAACGNFEKADLMRTALSELKREPAEIQRVDQRLAQWKSFYRQHAPVAEETIPNTAARLIQTSLHNATAPLPERFAQASNLSSGIAQPMTRPAPSTPGPQASRPTEPTPPRPMSGGDSTSDGIPRMVLVDVVLVSTQELVSTSKGINLLSALTLQLGAVGSGKPAYSRDNISNRVSGAAESVSTAITRAVTIPALAYSLNIANASNTMNEVLARPTLAAMEGMPSEFFSGTNLSAGVVAASAQGGTTVIPVEKRFGVKLAVTPVFLSNGRVQLKVEAQRTSLNATADNPRVTYQLEIAETTANANVVMNLGDTLVLSGLSEKSTANTREGVPVLQDVPVIQYLFSNKKTNDIQRSVLILITPRAPAYTANPDLGNGTTVSASTQMLRDKFGFTGNTPSSVDAILSHLKTNDLFREFRQGDVTLERWDRMHSTGDRLRQALGFLYY